MSSSCCGIYSEFQRRQRIVRTQDIRGGNDCLLIFAAGRHSPAAALRVLSTSGMRVVTQDAFFIRLEGRPGTLATSAKRFRDAVLEVCSMYILRRDENESLFLADVMMKY